MHSRHVAFVTRPILQVEQICDTHAPLQITTECVKELLQTGEGKGEETTEDAFKVSDAEYMKSRFMAKGYWSHYSVLDAKEYRSIMVNTHGHSHK